MIGLGCGATCSCLASESTQRTRKLDCQQGSGRDVLHVAHLVAVVFAVSAQVSSLSVYRTYVKSALVPASMCR